MTVTDWRIHATEADQQRFADAQARLDEGDYPDSDEGHAQRLADQRFADWYDQAVNAAAYDEFERQCKDADFHAAFPEPEDGARIEFEADRGRFYAAYRSNDPDNENFEGRWYLYGSDERWSWRDLVFRFQIDMDGLVMLVDRDEWTGQLLDDLDAAHA